MVKCLYNDFPEFPSQYQIYNEIYGCIEDQSEMIEAGHAEKPGRGEEEGSTPVNIWVRDLLDYFCFVL